jgi:hypothetical protein
LITDTHWSARKSSKLFQDYFERFYHDIFFPTLEKYGITTVIHLGDAFDNRKSIDFGGLEWTRRVVLDSLSNYDVHMITGNHDIFLRNSNQINSPNLLLQDYKNIKVYSDPTEIEIDKLKILLLPWITSENEGESIKMIEKSQAKVVMGHLELYGFRINHQMISDYGMKPDIFDKFSKVFSGHYHTRSDNGKVYYFGNPYEIYWSDLNDTRGFAIFDTETLNHSYINNPYKMFYNIYYEDTNHQTFDARKYNNKIVKVIVRKKTSEKQFEQFVDKLHSVNVAELKILENFDIQENEKFEALESEDTISILSRYIEEAEVNLDKSALQKMMKEIYKEACELE